MRRLREDDGAVAVIVALLVTFVFLPLAALVVDVGNLYWERRQLQNGADAAALAAAQDYANGDDALAEPSARSLATENNTREAFVESFEPQLAASRVRVTARTGDISGGGLLRPFVAQVLDGFDQDQHFTRASATAAWGRFGGGRSIPIALCERLWDSYTTNGSAFGPPAREVHFAGPGNGNGNNEGSPHLPEDQVCLGPAGDTYPGGFGFLERDEECYATTTEDALTDGSPGNNLNDSHSDCGVDEVVAMLEGLVDDQETALIPIFDDHVGSGSGGQFHIIGYGGFRLTGFEFNAPGNISYGDSGGCINQGGMSCLVGYFTEFVALDGVVSEIPGDDYGASVVYLAE